MHIIHTIGCQVFLNILPHLAKALGVSADELMGLEKTKKNGRTHDNRLWQRPATPKAWFSGAYHAVPSHFLEGL